MGKSIAILTHYYNSKNYGGNLQSYALVKILNNMEHKAEQVCYVPLNLNFKPTSKVKKLIKVFNPKKVLNYLKNKKTQRRLSERFKNIKKFNIRSIEHSEKIYNDYNLNQCVDRYDCFITGSDQVWNLKWYYPAYFLDFVKSDKIKMSYAASMPQTELDESQKQLLKNHLSDFKAVSVRESHVVDLVKQTTSLDVEFSLDPTLLLEKEEWESVASKRLIEEPYVFCYLFGEDKKQRKIVKAFAKKHKLKIVTLPYPNGRYRKCDAHFGDIKMLDAGIEDFLSLIKYAEYVFTDSFHATVFSGIFEKQYFIFQRKGAEYMASRIYTLGDLYETPERFCDTKEKASLEYVESLDNIDYKRPLNKLNEMKQKSIEYLKRNLEK